MLKIKSFQIEGGGGGGGVLKTHDILVYILVSTPLTRHMHSNTAASLTNYMPETDIHDLIYIYHSTILSY